jgi:Domain of unknown function (DUF4188)
VLEFGYQVLGLGYWGFTIHYSLTTIKEKWRMASTPRTTVDLSGYPDLVVIYLGMRVRNLRGLATLTKLGPQINKSVAENPDGLLLHESLIYGLFPPHIGMRQYWRDWESMEKWTRTLPHKKWWGDFLKDSGGTLFWHETYYMKGGIEAVFDDMGKNKPGLSAFAPTLPAKGAMFSARKRLKLEGETPAPILTEEELEKV